MNFNTPADEHEDDPHSLALRAAAATRSTWVQEVESNAVEVHIHNLRRKLGNAVIRTVRGVGYILPADSSPSPQA